MAEIEIKVREKYGLPVDDFLRERAAGPNTKPVDPKAAAGEGAANTGEADDAAEAPARKRGKA